MTKKSLHFYSLAFVFLLGSLQTNSISAENSMGDSISAALVAVSAAFLVTLIKDGTLYLWDRTANSEVYESAEIASKIETLEQKKQNLEVQEQVLTIMAGSIAFLPTKEQQKYIPQLQQISEGLENSRKKFTAYEKEHQEFVMNLK